MDDNDEKIPAAAIWGILGPVFDWTAEQRAEVEPESNIICLADYRLLH